MIVLHIAKIQTNVDNGVNAVVPKHVAEQRKYAETAMLNINNVQIPGVKQLRYDGSDAFPGSLPVPFNKPDIAVFHEVNVIEFIGLYKKLKKAGIPYVIVPHGEITEQALKKKWLKKKIAYFLWFNAFVKNAKKIQCLSLSEQNRVRLTDNTVVIGNGTDIPEISKSEFSDKGLKLIYIGRLERHIKGLDRLIEAIAGIADTARKNGISLDIYGPDVFGRRADIQSLIDNAGVGDLIKIYDPVFGDKKEKALLEHDIFIQTSRSEGLPLGVLEAMAYAMPVILTKGTSMMEDMKKCDGGYPAGDSVEEIKNAVLNAFSDKKEWKQKGDSGRKFIIENYSWAKIGKEEIEQYGKIINENK